MIGLDTNVLARYYIEDAADTEAQQQRLAARRLIEDGEALAVCKTVLLALEWVMRGYYALGRDEIAAVYRHLLSLEYVEIEDRTAVEQALDAYDAGLDFADSLHHASYHACASMATFDDRKFARRQRRLSVPPPVRVVR